MLIIDPDKKFYRGNTHTHTTCSDGRRTREECIAQYRALGHDFLAITDHWKLGAEERHGDFLVMRGAENNFRLHRQDMHIVGLLPGDADPGIYNGFDDHNEAIRRINAAGGAAIFAHPAWSMNTLDVMLNLEDVCAAEIFNAVSGMPWNGDRAYSTSLLDIAANHGRLFHHVTGDDTHFYTGECGMGVNMVQAEDLTAESIIAALKAHKSYCTQGPEIYRAEYNPETRVYSIDCSPASRIVFYSDAVWSTDRCTSGENMTHKEYIAQNNEHYLRCEVVDAQGRRAWIAPIAI